MGSMIEVRAPDNLQIPVYLAEPSGGRKGALVVIQEIFGVNDYIRAVADEFAEQGYITYAPDLYHRIERGIELPYDPEGVARGRSLKDEAGMDYPTMDVVACVATLRVEHPVGVVGFCYGGTLAWLSVCRGFGVDAAVCYYGGQIASHLDKAPKGPVQMHFGSLDPQIPPEDIHRIRDFAPNADVHVYEGADHGFSCHLRGSHHPEAAEQARDRTLAFLENHVH